MKKIKILEVNNIDLPGRRFNGYDMIEELSDDNLEITQAVINKLSNNDKVVKILNNNSLMKYYELLMEVEEELSIHNVFSITSPSLMDLEEYKEANVIHFHMFHNTKLSLYSLTKIANEKKVIISLHDPWFVTGRCVHFYECDLWKTGCKNCHYLNTLFPFHEDNCDTMWNLKRKVFNNIDVDLVVSTDWMLDLVTTSPITNNQKNIHKIPFGIDYKKFNKVTYSEARKHYNFSDDEVVLFLRAQNEFKGTPYVLEALKMLDTKEKVTVLTCDNKGLLEEVSDKYKIIDLGNIDDAEMIYAMNACDIFLMPSIGESFGMMAIEAMACSKPVVVFDNSALPSVTKAPECGYLVKNKDSEDLMKAIKYLVENPKECKKRGKMGYKIVKEDYSIEEYNNKLIKLYKSANKRKHKPCSLDRTSEDDYNIEQFKCFLNELTDRLFNSKSSMNKQLKFDTKEIKYDRDYKIKFDDIELQELLYNYTFTIQKYLKENDNAFSSNTKGKIKKVIYLLKNNPKLLLKKFLKRIINK